LRWITAIGHDEIAQNSEKSGCHVYGGRKMCTTRVLDNVWMHVYQ